MTTASTGTKVEIHTIFGAGQVGRQLASELLSRGLQVRILRRGPAHEAQEGLTWLQGDLLDPAVADAACEGASVVYHCVNPARYDRWAEELPPLFDAVVGAAKRHKAKLVVLDNVYMYGHAEGKAYTEMTPMRPCCDKGELRASLATKLLALQESGELEIAVGRAADYFGPNTMQTAVFHERFFDQLQRGKKLDVIGDPDALHSYSYTPDVARGLAILGTSDASWGKIWHLPVAFQGTTRELVEKFAEASGHDARLRPASRLLLRGLGLFSPQIRSAIEMLYQFEEDYTVDDSRFTEAFGDHRSSVDDAVSATLESLR